MKRALAPCLRVRELSVLLAVAFLCAGPATGQVTIEASGSSIVSESCAPANNGADPGELVTVSLCLVNNGATSATGVSAALEASGGVLAPSGSQSYGDLAAGGGAVCRDYTFAVSSALACGDPLTLTLRVSHSGGESTALFALRAAAQPVSPKSFTFSPAIAIPDNDAAGVNIPLVVSGLSSRIADLNFRIDGASCSTDPGATGVGLDHTYVGNLVVKLTSPAGTTVTLMSRPGPSLTGTSGNNFCQTVLDDDGQFPPIQRITSAAAPYSGTFLPNSPLGAFDNQNPNGTWTLNVADVASSDSGSVRALTLIFTTYECCTQSCTVTCPADIAVNNAPGTCGQTVTFDPPTTSGGCGAVTTTPASGSTFPIGTTVVACVSAGGPNCTFRVTVNDVEAPSITCPGELSVNAGANCQAAVPDLSSLLEITSNCPAATDLQITQDPAAGTLVGGGATTITVTATDTGGNVGTCSTTFRVNTPDGDGDGTPDCAESGGGSGGGTGGGGSGGGSGDGGGDGSGDGGGDVAGGCGACGAGGLTLAPALLLAMAGLKWRWRRLRR